ncbi:MAG: LysE family transporter, partial [Burkholderiales bacterium]|nr:LysE family transporter [Burkholderiales bacterium]
SIAFILGLFGIGVLVIGSKITFDIIKYLGAIYLTYLALKSIFIKVQISEPQMIYQETKIVDKWQYFRIGLFCNLTNPKAFLFIVSLSTYVAEQGNPAIDGWFIILGSGIATLIWFTVVAFIFGRASVRKVFYAKQKIINIVFGFILLYVASKIVIL